MFPPLVAHLVGDIHQFAASMEEANGIAKAMADNTSKAWKSAGTQLMGVGLGIAGASATIMGVALHAAVEFDKQMELVHTQAGASQAEVESLKGSVKDLAAATGVGPEKLAEALFHVESVGYRGADAMSVLDQSAKLAMVSGANMDDVTYGLTSTMQTFGAGAQDAAKWAAFFNATVGAGDMRMEAFSKAVGTGFFSTAQTFGISAQSAGAALAFMTDRGSQADESATRLRMTIALMAAPSQKATHILESLGLTGEDVAKSHTLVNGVLATSHIKYSELADDLQKPDGFYVALQHLKKGLEDSGMSAEAANAQLSHAFGGGKSDATLLAMLNNLDTLKSKYDAIGAGMDSWGESQRAALETPAVQFERLKATLSDLAIDLGEQLLPAGLQVVAWLQSAAQWTREHTDVVKDLAIALGVLLVGGLTMATVGAIAFAAATIEVWGPILLITVAIMAVVAVLIYLYTHWDEVHNKIVEVATTAWNAVKSWLSSVWDTIKGAAIDAWNAVLDYLSARWDSIRQTATDVFETVKSFFSTVWDAIKGKVLEVWNSITSFLSSVWASITGAISGAWNAVTQFLVSTWNGIRDTAVGVWNGIKDWFAKWWPLLLEIFAPAIFGLIAMWHAFGDTITGLVTTVWNWIKDHLSAAWNWIKNTASTLWNGITSAISTAVDDVKTWVSTKWEEISIWVEDKWHHIQAMAQAVWNAIATNIIDPIKKVAEDIGHWLENIWSIITQKFWDILNWISDQWNTFYNTMFNLVGALVSAVGAAWNWLTGTVSSLIQGAVNTVQGFWNSFFDVGYNIVTGIGAGLKAAWGWLTGTVSNLATSALNAAKAALGVASPSKLFADEVGAMIPQGIAVGVVAHTGSALESIRALSGSLLETSKLAVTGTMQAGTLAVTGAGVSTAGGVIQVNLTSTAQVDGQTLFTTQQTQALRYQARNGIQAFAQ